MCKGCWKKLEVEYSIQVLERDSCIINCRSLFRQGKELFEQGYFKLELIGKAKSIALKQNETEFYQFLQEGQYWISFLTAYFLLEYFDLESDKKLIGLNDNLNVIDGCIENIESSKPF